MDPNNDEPKVYTIYTRLDEASIKDHSKLSHWTIPDRARFASVIYRLGLQDFNMSHFYVERSSPDQYILTEAWAPKRTICVSRDDYVTMVHSCFALDEIEGVIGSSKVARASISPTCLYPRTKE